MDPSENISNKKQRNAQLQRDKRKKTYSKSDSVHAASPLDSGPIQNPAVAPQPQRTNCRQRNESTNNTAEETTKVAPVSQDVKENMIDHSNLKRETEEIVKLTKKFSKREVSSNWHRYTAEDSVSAIEQLDEGAPADFSDLLTAPVSRGGHLQLKEEQGWSSVTPVNHWSLDLKQLSFSLACIPTHERLRLPVEKLSEEEINRYIFLAEEAKSYYSAYEGDDSKDDVSYKDKPFNILDVERSTNALLDMNLGLEKSFTNLGTSERLVKEDKIPGSKSKLSKINEFLNIEKPDDSNKTNSTALSIDNDEYKKPTIETTLKEKLGNDNLVTNQQPIGENLPNETKETKSQPLTRVEVQDSVRDISCKISSESDQDVIYSYEIKDKRERRPNRKSLVKEEIDNKTLNNSNEVKIRESPVKEVTDNKILNKSNGIQLRESPVKEEIVNKTLNKSNEAKIIKSPIKEEIENKTLNKLNEVKLEDDDDDLDFLLSLKTPIKSEKKKESKPPTLKDSSFLPGVTTTSSSSNPVQQTDLDDWLDSVLED